MICKVCGYESNENFSVCPYCGEETSPQNQALFENQNNQYNQGNQYNNYNQNNQYNQGNQYNNSYNQNNQYNPSQYQTPFTKPNTQNNQYNQENQYNNYNSEPISNYGQNQSYSPIPVARKHKGYSANMPEYFRGFGCSFEINQNALKISRFLNGGEFSIWALVVGIICSVLWFILMLSFVGNFEKGMFELVFTLVFFLGFLFIHIFKYAVFKVDSSGIIVKTILKGYFIPREKIDSIVCQTVTRSKGRYGTESFYDVFLVMKDKSFFNKHNLDTGLCYKNKIHVDYLIDMFNERLGFL